MPFATKTGDLAMPLSWWTSYIWKDVFFSVEISTCWLLLQVPEGSFFEEVFRRLGLCSLPLPHDFTFFFFFLRDFHLLPLKSQVHGSPSLRRNPVSWWGTHSVQAAGRGCRGGLRGGGDAAWGHAVESPAHLFGPP